MQLVPLPSLKRLIPIYAAYWNTAKGGSDTLTKLMDDCILRPPKVHSYCESVAFTRCIMILLTLIHCLIQINTAKEDINDYSSLKYYRNAASQAAQ